MANTEGFCPKVQPIDGEMTKLSYNDRLKLVETEAQSLYAFCLKKGFTDSEMYSCVSRLHGPAKPKIKQALDDSKKSFFYISIMIGIIAWVWASPFGYNMFVIHTKLFSIKFVLPYWNWASLYQEDCMIANVWLPTEEAKIDAKYCQYCRDVVKYGNNVIDRLNDTNSDEIMKHYILNGQPVVVTDTSKDWQTKKKLSMDELAILYQNDPFLASSMGSCNYSTNVGFNETFYDFITAYVDKVLPKTWHASWQNCDTKSGKIIRQFYTRPYFLPDMAQAGMENSIIASSGGQADEYFTIPLAAGMSGHWVTVVSGNLQVQLSPVEECIEKYKCKVASLELGVGESVFFTEGDWDFAYTPTNSGITLAIASSVIWDEM